MVFFTCMLMILTSIAILTSANKINIEMNNFNNPPNPPEIEGPTHGKILETQVYNITVTDPDEDEIFYKFDWGDESFSEWLGPYPSGMNLSASHVWGEGSYNIKVKAMDINEAESDWSEPQWVWIMESQTAFPEEEDDIEPSLLE